MPLKKILFRPGVNRENTRYAAESMGAGGAMSVANAAAGWYDCEKVRFRSGSAEKIGGWLRISAQTFLGVCRSLAEWVTLGSLNLMGVGTNLKFYIENGGNYYDITPIRETVSLGADPFETTDGSNIVIVTDAGGGYSDGDFVTFYGATSVGGLDLNGEYQLTSISATEYTIEAASAASSSATGGGSAVTALYQVSIGPSVVVPLAGWGAGYWGAGAWGIGEVNTESLRIWNQDNYGEDLIINPGGGQMYLWDASLGFRNPTFTVTIASPAVVTTSVTLADGTAVMLQTDGALPTGLDIGVIYYVVNSTGTSFNLAATAGGTEIDTTGSQSGTHRFITRAVPVADLAGANEVPLIVNNIFVSDINRFVFALGCEDVYQTQQDPMLIRWSDQENVAEWAPSATNQAGSIRLSNGSKIIAAIQSRQEIVVLTDTAVYSLQYVGAPVVWGSQLLGDNISITGVHGIAVANNIVYWMGKDKFYKYDGTVQTLRCDLRQFIFSDINTLQFEQVCCGTNEGFNEIWWHYCTANSNENDRYVVYNYLEDIWYYGSIGRTAWLDSSLSGNPIAATYANNLVEHEIGNDDGTGAELVAIESYISSAEFDLDDGHNFMFIWRMLPDITFRGSNSTSPSGVITLLPLKNSGSGYTDPASVGGSNFATVTRTAQIPIEQFTGQVYTRVRGRQLAFKMESSGLGVAWQLGAPRLDLRPDGRR